MGTIFHRDLGSPILNDILGINLLNGHPISDLNQ